MRTAIIAVMVTCLSAAIVPAADKWQQVENVVTKENLSAVEIESALRDESVAVRKAVLFRLRYGDDTALEPLIIPLLSDSSWTVRRSAAIALEHCGTERSRMALEERARHDANPTVRCRAVAALAHIKTPGSYPLLRDLLTDSHFAVRGTAAKEIAVYGDTEIIPRLELMAAHDPVAYVRIRANETLRTLRGIIPTTPRCGNGQVYGLIAVIVILVGIVLLRRKPFILAAIVIIAGLSAGYVILKKPSTGYYRALVLLLDTELREQGIMTSLNSEELREFIAADIQDLLGSVRIVSRWQPLTAGYNRDRGQYDAGVILKNMLVTMPNQAAVFITGIDLFQEPFHHAMGYGTKNAAVISLRRIDPVYLAEGTGDTEDIRIFKDRVRKLVRHEIGHMYGLTHCSVNRCTMRSIEYEEEYVNLDADFCEDCRSRITH